MFNKIKGTHELNKNSDKNYIVLVNEQNQPIGTTEKLSAHNQNTPLHRGISVFLFDKKGNLLLQQRSNQKKTWPSIWSNSCCGHPLLNETSIETAQRILLFELGISQANIKVILPDYRYKFQHKGIFENEYCPVLIATTSQQPTINHNEIQAIQWITWGNWLNEIEQNPEKYSEWSVEETKLLNQNKEFHHFLKEATQKLPSK